MRRLLGALALLTAGTIALSGCASGGSSSSSNGKYSGTVTIAHSSWIGFYPLDLAVQKGFFKKHGVNVKISDIESKSDSRAALISNKIQGVATTIDTQVVTASSGAKISVPLALDTSYGGDGLVAKKDITSFSGLKGKTVALDTTGGASFFWFNYELQQHHMKLSDMTVENMSSGDAGSAFAAGKVDAAMTWEPWLTKAKATSFGHVLMDSTEAPGVIVDTLGLSRDFIQKYPKSTQAIVDGWFDAINYLKSNESDALKIMAKVSGSSADELKSELTGIKFYTKAQNKDLFGTKDKPGQLVKTAKYANQLWVDTKITTKKADIDALLDSSFVK